MIKYSKQRAIPAINMNIQVFKSEYLNYNKFQNDVPKFIKNNKAEEKDKINFKDILKEEENKLEEEEIER